MPFFRDISISFTGGLGSSQTKRNNSTALELERPAFHLIECYNFEHFDFCLYDLLDLTRFVCLSFKGSKFCA